MKWSRRHVLRGAGGVVLGLPLLEGLRPREARGAEAERPRFAVFARQSNGVAQAGSGEPDRFWPTAYGALTTDLLASRDAGRAISELSAYASQMLLVSGLKFNFSENGCSHSGGGNQCLTAAKVSKTPSGNRSLSMGESIDNRMARELNVAGRGPLTLYVGQKSGYVDEVLSYRPPPAEGQPAVLQAAENNPFNIYSRMTELVDADAETRDRVARARISVNDLVREQMRALLANPRLSSADRGRLDTHFEAVREFEVQLSCIVPTASVTEMKALVSGNAFRAEANYQKVARLQSDLIAIALACGYTRTATLQYGEGLDSSRHTFDGVRYESFHHISHRIHSDGDDGSPISDAVLKHHTIDRMHAQLFKHLLDRLSAHGILNDSVAVWLNDIAHGVSHTFDNIPFVMVGSCGGYLKTGTYVNARAGNAYTPHNKLLNTLLNAVGCRKADGSLVDDFGDASLPKGELLSIKA